MSLFCQERKELHEAIMDAYPNPDTFKQMMDYELDINLDLISTNDSYDTVVFDVIKNFNSQGRLLEFVEKAHEYNSGNENLRTCYEKWCLETSPSPIETPITIEQRIEHLSQLLENNKWKKADAETSNILLQAGRQENRDCLEYEYIEQLDCNLLLKIDELWRSKSDNHFGFRIQKEIWEQLQKSFKSNLSNMEKEKEFGKELGWYVDERGGTGKWISRVDINPSWDFDKPIRGYLPTPPPCIQGKYPIKVHLTLALVEKLKRCQQELRN